MVASYGSFLPAHRLSACRKSSIRRLAAAYTVRWRTLLLSASTLTSSVNTNVHSLHLVRHVGKRFTPHPFDGVRGSERVPSGDSSSGPLPLANEIENLLRRLLTGLPFHRRTRVEQKPSDCAKVAAVVAMRPEPVRGPDERLSVELAVASGGRRAMREQHAHGVGPTFVRGRMQPCLADLLVWMVRVETTG